MEGYRVNFRLHYLINETNMLGWEGSLGVMRTILW